MRWLRYLRARLRGELRHWYAYSFIGSAGVNGAAYASVYVGYPNRLITRVRIEEAKQGADMPARSTLIAVSYLGYGKRELFVSPAQPQEPKR